MANIAFQRLISNTTDVFLGIDREQAAFNAANGIGSNPNTVPRFPTWPSVEKFMNDTVADGSPSPFANVPNPEYIWDGTPQPGQTVSMAIASNSFVPDKDIQDFSVSIVAFADNAMEAKIELFIENAMGNFVPVVPQPEGLENFVLIAGTPNNPATGLTETQPFNWQDVRVYSTEFRVEKSTDVFKIVFSYEATNYLTPPNGNANPAALQFMSDIYLSAFDD